MLWESNPLVHSDVKQYLYKLCCAIHNYLAVQSCFVRVIQQSFDMLHSVLYHLINANRGNPDQSSTGKGSDHPRARTHFRESIRIYQKLALRDRPE